MHFAELSKATRETYLELLSRIIRGLQKASIASGDSDTALQANLDALKVSLMQQDLPGKVAKAVKEFHASVSKLGKVKMLHHFIHAHLQNAA